MTATATRGIFATDEIRAEGRDKVSGRNVYTADVQKPGALWAAFAISPFAHARVLRIDVSAAREVPGVRAVLTAADIGHVRMGRNLYDWPVLASEVVRYPGERVAAVAAETREAAERAAGLVDVDYEELPAILDPEDALRPGAAVLHPDRASYYFASYPDGKHPAVSHPNVQGEKHVRKGTTDIDAVFASAARVFTFSCTTPRLHAGHIEPRATVVWIDDDGTVHVVSANKGPFPLRDQIATTTGVPLEKIVIEPSAVGGDFGGKGLTIDEIPCYYLARATGRPVRHVESPTEALRAGPYRHPAHITLTTAVDADGKFIAHRSRVLYDGGAYAGGKPTAYLLPGSGYFYVPYRIPNADIEVRTVYTNAAPPAHIRTPVSVQLYFGWEQHVDIMAEALGFDPLAFRLHNCMQPGDTFPSNEQPRDVTARAVLEALRRETRWTTPPAPGHGRGIAFAASRVGGGSTSVRMTLAADGSLEIVTGVPDQGVGVHTVMRRVAAAALDLEEARITVRRGATGVAGRDPGVGAAWGTHINGRATEDAARLLREALDAGEGTRPLSVVGTYGTGLYADVPSDFMFTALGIEVAVDRETGAFCITDVVMVVDVGTIINPVAHQGQLDGGFIYGLGNALMEEIVRDESGLVTTLSFGDYKLPTIADIPPLRTVLVHSAPGEGPFGAKAAGEVSNIAVPAAVMNAVADATGVRLSHFPITAERLFEALTAQGPQPLQ